MTVPEPTDAPALRWGIIAPGGIAHKFAEAVTDLTRGSVVAVGSRSIARAQDFARLHGIPRVHEGYADLVADEGVEAVYVASPHSAHRDHALLAINAGKHVLVEKALARNSGEVEEILAAAKSAGVFAMEAMWTRHLPHIDWLRERVAAGAIGEIVQVTADHGQALDLPADHRLKDPALAGGAMLDLGVYPVSFIIDLLGEPAQVAAIGHLTETGVDGHVSVVLGYSGRRLAQADTTLWTKTPTTAVVSGTEGSLEIDGDFYQPNVVRLRRADSERTIVEEWDGHVPNGFQFEAAEVARCVAGGRQQSERMTWESSRAVMRVMDEVRRQVGVVYPGE
ncbi:Gfo/Idh/MocA family protein [Leekyejoonella antrihumi]|uniref:Gfo/Idh/MocA family oxidoreductase n=1 Tax=Leekyejoonella antrihumi TaxID=1660198 RepID=A0A563DW08_9MICO|nr:Gfo/Idh/MocA family oxidoreductase [Leekyejoonella antrihumi]TWP34397.1 Gfo/Idh/MocA family oxidoreductase [Leekyejoonella antrihumi]